ncbi:MAG: 16S rRNA (adenine1518-N6/adenine1519-N6)-dimethyltransferase [Halioglobus sp.]|jgi:16S rRNA (adenine1518-N6/adenine1519-N6)-dimethyltransferase
MSKPELQHRARKRFGQNFLHDSGVINRIIESIHPRAGEQLVEIGPGQGALTQWLMRSGCQLDVVELDRDLVPALLDAYDDSPKFNLHNADALKFDYRTIGNSDDKIRVVGNLPYNISTPLIFKLLENSDRILDMHFMLQLEVVNRLAASPGSKNWGRLGIMTQYHCEIESLFEVPPSAFTPAPKVQSAIVRMVPRQNSQWPDCDETLLRKIVQASFAQRRKTLRNNLKGLIDAGALEAIGIDPSARAETLELHQFIEIANIDHG